MRESEEATVLTSVGGEGEGGITLEKGREGYANEHADRYANELALLISPPFLGSFSGKFSTVSICETPMSYLLPELEACQPVTSSVWRSN